MHKKILHYYPILALALILVFLMTGKETSAATTFHDVPANYSKEINYLIEKGVINGYPDKTFRPNSNVTREEAVTMIGKMLGYNGNKPQTYFKDVKVNSWSSGYIQSAVEMGTISQNDERSFRPTDNMTRGEIAYFLSRVFNFTERNLLYIPDVASPQSLNDAVNKIITAGLSNGYPDGTYKPQRLMTRAEFAILVARGLNEEFRVSSNYYLAKYASVNSTTLNVYTEPTQDSNIAGTFSSGTQLQILDVQGDWVNVSVDSLTGFVHRDSLTVLPNNKVMALDPGHGGHDPGAIGNGLFEEKVNLSVSLKVQKILQQNGITVIMTRTDDTYLTLRDRVKVSIEKGADTFLSIHANWADAESANGTETYYSTASLGARAENSKQLATFIQNRLYQALGTRNRGVKQAEFTVIDTNPLPAALVELGFISNKNDAAKLDSEEYQNKAAYAIAYGIIDYYNWRK